MGFFDFIADSFTDLSKPGFSIQERKKLERVRERYEDLVYSGVINDINNTLGILLKHMHLFEKDFSNVGVGDYIALSECRACYEEICRIYDYIFQQFEKENMVHKAGSLVNDLYEAAECYKMIDEKLKSIKK